MRWVSFVGHDFRTTGLYLRNRRDIELDTADIEFFTLRPSVVVHPEVVVDTLL